MKNKTIIISVDGLNSETYNNPQYTFHNFKTIASKGGHINNLISIFPSVTWAAHASAITGCYPQNSNIIGNTVFSRKTKQKINYFEPEKFLWDDLVQTDSIYSICKRNKIKTASICWPLTQGASEIDYNIPEFYNQEFFDKFSTEGFWNDLKKSGLPIDKYALWSKEHQNGPMQDYLTNQILLYTLSKTDASVIFVHFLLIDSFLHDYGRNSDEVKWACDYVNKLIGDLLSFLEKNNEMSTTNLLVFSDHGHSDFQYYVHANAMLEKKGLYSSNILESDWIAVSNGGAYFMYCINKSYLKDELMNYFSNQEWAEQVLDFNQYNKINLPTTLTDTLPDFVVLIKPNYCGSDSTICDNHFLSKPTKYKSTHGYNPKQKDMIGFLSYCGPDFKPQNIDTAYIVDIAPTIAKLIGYKLECDGTALEIV